MAGNLHHRRLSRDARHLIRRMLMPGATGYRRAGVLHAQVAALDYAVSRRERRNMPLPGDTDLNGAGQRVRIGAEVRELLVKLQNSRNLREQQALVREIRHSVLRRIFIHRNRSRRLAGFWDLSRAVAIVAGRRARDSRAGAAVRRRAGQLFRGQSEPVRVVGSRKRTATTRARAQDARPAPERVLPDGERGSRAARARAPRDRVTQ